MLIKNFFIAFLMFFSIVACAENTLLVKDIQFKGLKNFSKNEALKKIVFSIGSQISQYDVQNSIKSLFKTGKFEDIKVVFSEKTVIFNIRERPVISNIVISGNDIINNSILDKYLKKLNIDKGKPLNDFFINTFIKTIEDFYYDIGRYKSNIKILKFFSRDNTVNLKILINEGTPIKINSIKIIGVQDFSKDKIFSLFHLKDYHSWWNFLDKSIYSPKALNNDLECLRNFYLSHGYFYFDFNAKKIDFLKNKNEVNITINVSEGAKYRISNFFVNGDLFPYEEFITNLIKINSYEVYNKEKIDLITHKITRFLSENGYINAIVTVNPNINHEKKTITLDFNIDIKKRFFVKKIHFLGNETTQDKVLRREIKQIEGQHFNIKLIELGKKSLEKTRYFSDVEIIETINPNESNQIDITYKVKEQPTGSINFGLGYGIDSGTSFNVSFSQENMFGSGNALKASIIKNNNQNYADISMSYPYFFSNSTDLNTRFFYNDLKYNFNSVSNLIKKTYGFESNLGFLINNTNRVNFGLGYTHNGINNKEKKNNALLLKKSLNTAFLQNSLVDDFTINYSWIYDNLEYRYFPTSGNQVNISGKNTVPGSDNNFYKIMLDIDQYIPLNQAENFIFLNHIYMGMGNLFNKEKLPFYENFYASSMNNIRGFRTNTIGPKKIYDSTHSDDCIGYKNNNNVCESIDSIGGNLTLVSNLELIVPTPFIDKKYSKFLRSSLFLDAGNIWDTQSHDMKNIDCFSFLQEKIFSDIYASVGLSLQWFSPIGPLVFSYAVPIQKNKNYQLEPFQFNMGKNW